MNEPSKTTAILLAGGIGTRMAASLPKQFLHLEGKPIALYSFELFLNASQIDEIVVVCAEEYRNIFSSSCMKKPVIFSAPGERRQDSVYNGFLAASVDAAFFCIHDSARPLIDQSLISRAVNAAYEYGAAAIGMPMRSTIKERDENGFVKTTLDRHKIWEIQTPQVIMRKSLHEGFLFANSRGITVTDDVSFAELIGQKVKLVEGSSMNIKITVPEDFILARQLVLSNGILSSLL